MIRVRLGDVTTDSGALTVVTLSSAALNVQLSPTGVVNVGLHNQRVATPYLATVLVTFSGLQPFTRYSYVISDGNEEISGEFTTMPADQTTPYSFIVGTCDGATRTNPMDTFQTMRRLVQEADPPVMFFATIDDVMYVDRFTVNDPATGFVSTGEPQVTGLAEDYAIGWAANFGMFDSAGKWQMADRQWIYRNLPHVCSGGDHSIAGNHCRGPVGHPTYSGCDRSPGGLQETALAEWDAFFGDANPAPMRAGEHYWAKQVGPVKMVSTDMQQHCVAFDPANPVDVPMLGQTQVDDAMAYLDVPDVPFKILFLESGFSRAGQTWLEYHQAEAEAWKSSLDARPNMNGTNGNFIGIYGDHHSMHSISFDTFWAFCPGTYGDSLAVGHKFANSNFGWGGQLRFLSSSFFKNGDNLIGGFLHVIVHADRTPQQVEIRIVDGADGTTLHSATLTQGAVANQFI